MRCPHATGFVRFFTFRALKWPLISIQINNKDLFTVPNETKVGMFFDKNRNLRMRSYMNGEFALLFERLFTNLALEAFVGKRTQMREQSLFREEFFIC